MKSLQIEHEIGKSKMGQYLSDMIQKYPQISDGGYVYPENQNGISRDKQLQAHRDRSDTDPRIHYGVVASNRGIWEKHAATTAAAYVRELLGHMSPEQL